MDKKFWNDHYDNQNTGWDIGYANKALTDYVLHRFEDKDSKILVPGAGRAYEVEYLWKQGYRNVHVIDLAPLAKEDMLKRVDGFPEEQYMLGNFFDLDQQFDLILEQTFFCAIDPQLRRDYTNKMHDILEHQGRLAGVLFNFEKPEGPPFGGSKAEYLNTFGEKFNVAIMEECYNSIKPRQGQELFFELIKKA